MAAEDSAAGSHAEIERSARHLLSLLNAHKEGATSSLPCTSHVQTERVSGGGQSEPNQIRRPSVQTEMTSSFPGLFSRGKRKRCFPAVSLVSAKKQRPVDIQFYLLPSTFEKTPNEPDQLLHTQAGLGRKTATVDESATHDEICDVLKILYPKMKTVTGGWFLYKASAGWGRRKMSLIAPEESGYTGRVLKMASNGGKCAIYISPVQEELDTAPLPLNDEAFKNMPKAVCHRCNDSIPLQFITEHLKCCGADKIYEESNKNEISPSIAEQPCPLCKEVFPLTLLESHAATCGDLISAGNAIDECSTVIIDDQDPVPGPSGTSTSTGEWFTIQDCDEAISQFRFSQTQKHLLETPLCLSMDIRQSVAEQDTALILFYKRPNIQWARPLNCRLEGDVAVGEGVNRFFFSTCIDRMKSGFNINFGNAEVTRVFDGEPGHLVPSASHFLIESDMFLMVGRMLGHSFIHGGPCLSGLSPAFIHVLLGGTPETATVTLEDCPDWDIRETIRLLEGDAEISEEDKQKVQELAAAWDLPPLNENNRRWMFEKLLMHAVIGRITRQTKQMRRGLKETGMWTVLTNRPDTLGLLFPTEGASDPVPEVLLRRITWPFNSGDDEDDDCDIDTKCRISGYVRQFIENATPDELKSLLRFWTGWEVMPTHVRVEVVGGKLFTACTCYETLRVPQHYNSYQAFQRDLLACIGTSHTGFGLI